MFIFLNTAEFWEYLRKSVSRSSLDKNGRNIYQKYHSQKRAPVGEEAMGRGNRRQMLKEEVIGALTFPFLGVLEVFLMARQHIIR